jgi:outer membrane protein assembly factor BamB
LNVKDGSEVWRTKMNPNYATSMPTRIGDVDVIIHPNGQAVRVADGVIIAKNLGSTDRNSPLVQDGRVFFMSGQARGAVLPTSIESASGKWEMLWKGKGTNLRGGGSWFPSPVLHEGLLYALNGSSAFTVVDALTGEKVYEEKLEFNKRGECYPSITLAGKYLFVSCDSGETIILEPGREFKEVGRNFLETFRSSLVFEGKRMYVRTTKNLWCIGE